MKKEEAPKKKQHWVPYFYLKNWATEDSKDKKYPQGWILSINEGEPQKVNLRDFSTRRYLYSPSDENGKRNFRTENKLSSYESVMADLWPDISNEFYDFGKNTMLRKGIALFVSLLYLRNPKNIEATKDIHGQLIDMYEKLPKDEDGNPCITNIRVKGKEYEFDNSDYADYKNSSMKEFQKMFIDNIHRQAVPIAEILINKRWAIVVGENEHFITSDKPVIVENGDREIFGLNTKGTTVTFPISPKRILVMDDQYEVGDAKYFSLHKTPPACYNYSIFGNANEFMLSNRHPDIICEEIVKYTDQYV